MAFFDLLGKGAKPFLINPSIPGESMILDVPKCIQQDGRVVYDQTSEWIIVAYQFNAGVLFVPNTSIIPGSFLFEDGNGGKPISPTHYWNDIYSSPLIECLLRCGIGKPLWAKVSQGTFSGVVYVWDPNYANSRRSNF